MYMYLLYVTREKDRGAKLIIKMNGQMTSIKNPDSSKYISYCIYKVNLLKQCLIFH